MFHTRETMTWERGAGLSTTKKYSRIRVEELTPWCKRQRDREPAVSWCIIQICREINRETRGAEIHPAGGSESRDRNSLSQKYCVFSCDCPFRSLINDFLANSIRAIDKRIIRPKCGGGQWWRKKGRGNDGEVDSVVVRRLQDVSVAWRASMRIDLLLKPSEQVASYTQIRIETYEVPPSGRNFAKFLVYIRLWSITRCL